MADINEVDLRGFISGAMTEVFDTMLSMDIELADGGAQGNVDGERIVGSVGFAGKAVGSVNIQVNEALPGVSLLPCSGWRRVRWKGMRRSMM